MAETRNLHTTTEFNDNDRIDFHLVDEALKPVAEVDALKNVVTAYENAGQFGGVALTTSVELPTSGLVSYSQSPEKTQLIDPYTQTVIDAGLLTIENRRRKAGT